MILCSGCGGCWMKYGGCFEPARRKSFFFFFFFTCDNPSCAKVPLMVWGLHFDGWAKTIELTLSTEDTIILILSPEEENNCAWHVHDWCFPRPIYIVVIFAQFEFSDILVNLFFFLVTTEKIVGIFAWKWAVRIFGFYNQELLFRSFVIFVGKMWFICSINETLFHK